MQSSSFQYCILDYFLLLRLFQPLDGFQDSNTSRRMDPLASQISFNGVLFDSRLADQLPYTKTLSPEDMTGVSSTSILGFARLVAHGTSGFDRTDVFSLLPFALNFLAYKAKRFRSS
jgi:hypothetical protein